MRFKPNGILHCVFGAMTRRFILNENGHNVLAGWLAFVQLEMLNYLVFAFVFLHEDVVFGVLLLCMSNSLIFYPPVNLFRGVWF